MDALYILKEEKRKCDIMKINLRMTYINKSINFFFVTHQAISDLSEEVILKTSSSKRLNRVSSPIFSIIPLNKKNKEKEKKG